MLQAAKKAYGQTASLDCHLAQTLVKRFMQGDELNDSLLAEVQRHLAVCSDCLAVANGKRKPLVERKQPSPWLAVLQQPKVVLMATGLVIVLALMSTVLRDPTKLLGPKAAAKAEAAAPAEPEETQPEEKPEEAAHEAVAKPQEPSREKPAEPEATSPAPSSQATEAALLGLQEADPDSEQAEGEVKVSAMGQSDVQVKANHGKPDPVPAKSKVLVVSEKKAKPKKAKPAPKKPTHETEKLKAPQRVAAPKYVDPLADVDVYDSEGRPIR